MKHFQEKIKLAGVRLYDMFSGNPHRYWTALLLCFFVLFLFIVAGNAYIYLAAVEHISLDPFYIPQIKTSSVNKKGLDTMLETLSLNKTRIQEILEAPPITDPSL